MKSNLKKLAVAAAVSFAFAAPASAAIGIGDNAGLFLGVYDTVNQASYVRDLGVSINAFGTQNRPTGGFTTVLDDQATDAFSSNAGTAWTSFLAAASNGTTNLIWDVVAVDSAGTSAADQKRVLYTSTTDAVSVMAAAGIQLTNSGVNNTAPVDTIYVPGANALLGAATEAFTTNPADPGNYNNAKSNNLAGGLAVALGTTSASIGQSMGFYYLTRSSATPTAEALSAAFKLGSGEAFQWTLNSAGNLTYGVSVAAVPEPSTWAMFAAGALMLGGIARRRMS
jgi:hypothetical protein